ncbi:alpha/beta fold hydrolase [Haematomicrobium sanguinis]|uniref:alpha/beta fold hydrolase n=1 Tax=Haematomicrobium sanguinis TaxID=479106 RepID=UPI00068E80DB|nr:alpha/beta fold hydrolase [Haematomicrobium sanguinis]
MTLSTSQLSVDGIRVRYRRTGTARSSGQTVLLVHGFTRSLDDWEELHARGSGFDLISLDLPGFGESQPFDGPVSIGRYAQFLSAFLDELGVADFHLVGSSLGGAIAMMLTVQHPDRVQSLLLADSAGFGRSVTPGLRVLDLKPVGNLVLSVPRLHASVAVHGLFHDRRHATRERIDANMRYASVPHYRELIYELGASLGNLFGVRRGWRTDLVSRLARLDVPITIVWGAKDRVLPARHLRHAARLLPRAATILLPRVGHLPQIEAAARFAEIASELWNASGRGNDGPHPRARGAASPSNIS